MQTETNRKDIIFYDGTCGLCHWFVKWVLRHDAEGKFLLSPLQGETLRKIISPEQQAKLPDSVVVLTSAGNLLTRFAAAKYVVELLGIRGWAILLRMSPRWLADLGYNVIARLRYRLFGRNRQDVCALLPPELRARFLP